MKLTRRVFLGSVAACAVPAFGAAREPRLRLGVLSDLHIFNEKGVGTVRKAPEFSSGAQVTVETRKPAKDGDIAQIVLRFPAAEARQKCRVFEYEISAVLCEDDVELIQLQRRMMSPDFYLPESKLHREVEFVLAEEDLPVKGHYRFAVRPIECYGKRGKPIYSAVSV